MSLVMIIFKARANRNKLEATFSSLTWKMKQLQINVLNRYDVSENAGHVRFVKIKTQKLNNLRYMQWQTEEACFTHWFVFTNKVFFAPHFLYDDFLSDVTHVRIWFLRPVFCLAGKKNAPEHRKAAPFLPFLNYITEVYESLCLQPLQWEKTKF